MTTAGNNIAIMRTVPREHRSFALAPKCVPEYDDDGDDGGFSIGPECASQRAKLRFTWLLCVLWLGWAVLGFGLAWLIVFRRHRGAAKRATGDGLPELHVQRRAHDDDDDDDDEDSSDDDADDNDWEDDMEHEYRREGGDKRDDCKKQMP